jgi:hypothetical protein
LSPTLKETEFQADEWRLMVYQKGVMAHFWSIGEIQESTHERKAKRIQKGQVAFAAFLLFLTIVLRFGRPYGLLGDPGGPALSARSSAAAELLLG